MVGDQLAFLGHKLHHNSVYHNFPIPFCLIR